MAVTKQDLQDFTEYAEARLANGGAAHIRELFHDWLKALSDADIDAAIREGIADVDAGRTRPFDESMADFRRERGLPPGS